MANYNRVMGFDYGTKRIGIACGQMVTNTANALTVITTIKGAPNWEIITKLIKEWRPQALVVGLPLNMDDTSQKTTELATLFAKQLEAKFKLPIYFVDERLTTRAAREEVFTQGGYKALQETKIDAYAAKLILESWMHEQKTSR